MDVLIRYVDGQSTRATIDLWPTLRAEGVDEVWIYDLSGVVTFSGQSLYWVYPDGDMYVAGSAAVAYSKTITEIVFDGLGGQTERHLHFLPDLAHADVKLGHWWPDKPRPVE